MNLSGGDGARAGRGTKKRNEVLISFDAARRARCDSDQAAAAKAACAAPMRSRPPQARVRTAQFAAPDRRRDGVRVAARRTCGGTAAARVRSRRRRSRRRSTRAARSLTATPAAKGPGDGRSRHAERRRRGLRGTRSVASAGCHGAASRGRARATSKRCRRCSTAARTSTTRADVDHTTPLLIATINGQFDVAMLLIERGADPNIASTAGMTPLYATINTQWAPKSRYPQPQAVQNQKTSYLDVMKALLDARARSERAHSRRSRGTSRTTTAATRTAVSRTSKARRRSGARRTRSTSTR